MTGRHERLQVARLPKVRIDITEVFLPVTVESFVRLFGYRRDPDRVHAESLDVVQLVDQTLKRAAAIVPHVGTGRGVAASPRKTIRKNLRRSERSIRVRVSTLARRLATSA